MHLRDVAQDLVPRPACRDVAVNLDDPEKRAERHGADDGYVDKGVDLQGVFLEERIELRLDRLRTCAGVVGGRGE